MELSARPKSAAVKIVNPAEQDRPSTPRKDAVQRKCKNIIIHGFCKYQAKGCAFPHPPSDIAEDAPPSPNPQTPITHTPPRTTLTAQAVNAPVFIPKGALFSSSPPPPEPSLSAPMTSLHSESPKSTSMAAGGSDYIEGYQGAYDISQSQHEDVLIQQMEQLDTTSFYEESQYAFPSQYDTEAVHPYYSATVYSRQPLDYHLYAPAPSSSFSASTTKSHFVPPSQDLRLQLQKQSETVHNIAPEGCGLPDELQGYHTLVPLENMQPDLDRRKLGNWYTVTYKAIRTSNGLPYTLRRVENYRITHQSAFASVEFWSKIQHPGIISVVEAFSTKSFNDNSLVVVHTYHPNANTLYDIHLRPKPSIPIPPLRTSRTVSNQSQPPIIPERTIWSYVIQIASAIKKVHDAGQAVRVIDVTKILVTGQNRVRISTCGVIDILMHDVHQDLSMLQQEDLVMLGRLVLALCCQNVGACTLQVFQKSLEIMDKNYSQELKGVVVFLFSKGGLFHGIDQLLDMIRKRVVTELEDALGAADRLEYELLGELENARLVRLLCKLGFINERPEFACQPRWSETGDRYIIKLFRDYVFHQVDERNNPVVNLSHVLACLNKLDAGSDEKILLISRDEQSCLVVSYREIKSCIESAFVELTSQS